MLTVSRENAESTASDESGLPKQPAFLLNPSDDS
jgi:hypothetical protein